MPYFTGNKLLPDELNDLIDMQQIMLMYDLLSDILFWIKDANGKILYGNQSFLEHVGASSLNMVVGKNDFDFRSAHLAQQYVNDDQKVMAGDWVTNRLEMNVASAGEEAWFVTSKRPLLDKAGKIIGSYGISRHLERSLSLSGIQAIKVPIDYIREHYRQEIKIKQLAKLCHLSVSALERRFKKYLGKTPKQFINEIRLENARRLLVETNLPIAIIANQVGFTDQSYFSLQFRKQFSELPSELRKTFRVEGT